MRNAEEEGTVVFQPWGRRCRAPLGRTLLEIAQDAGLDLSAGCGGVGTCAECLVRVDPEGTSVPQGAELDTLLPTDLDAGLRLACQAALANFDIPVVVDVAPENRVGEQRSQVEGVDGSWPVRPSPHAMQIPARPQRPLGLAVDVGTTGIAVHLLDLTSGTTLGARGFTSPQIAYGEDVMSRLATVLRMPTRAVALRDVLVDELNLCVSQLCAEAKVAIDNVIEVVAVGNTAMHHLLFGLPVDQLALAPYLPAITTEFTTSAEELGLRAHRDAVIYSPPIVAGFVGGDHVAMLLASGAQRTTVTTLFLDIGTNTEISLLTTEGHWCCSAASGPAFEGAHVEHGMRAVEGAIEHVAWNEGSLEFRTIGDQPPVGVCGSGLIDAIAILVAQGAVTPRGAMPCNHPLVARHDRRTWIELVPGHKTASGQALHLTRNDVGEIQMAKAAVRAGVKLLTETAGVAESDIERIVIAGAFGTYVNRASARALGLIPPTELHRVQQVGNAAVSGARQLLVDAHSRENANQLVEDIRYLELTGHPDFQDRFTLALALQPDPWGDESGHVNRPPSSQAGVEGPKSPGAARSSAHPIRAARTQQRTTRSEQR